jgi:hypothetical protein
MSVARRRLLVRSRCVRRLRFAARQIADIQAAMMVPSVARPLIVQPAA